MSSEVLPNTDGSLSMFTLIGITLLVLLLTYVVKSLHQMYTNYMKLKHIPGLVQFFEKAPFKIPILAPYFYIASFYETEQHANKFLNKENTTMRIITNGNPVICTNDPKMFKEIFITKANSFEKTDLTVAKIFGDNIVTVIQTEEWKKHFKVCSPAFSPTNLRYMCKVSVESVELLFDRWNEKIKEGGNGVCMLTKQDLSDVTFQVLGKAGFNLDFGIFSNNNEGKQFKNALQETFSMKTMIVKGIFKSGFIGRVIEKALGITHAMQYCSDTLDKVVEERRENLKSGEMSLDETSDILTRLVEANMAEKLITDSELKSNAVAMAFAGHDTTSTLLQWVLYELSKRPDIQDKLCEEINKVLQGRDPTMDDYEELSYVNSVLMETLRKDSPVLVNGRVAAKDTTLGNYQIPKGATIYTLFNSLHKREDIWDKPLEFIPDRFVDPTTKDTAIQNFNWIPFSLGNRQCIGKKFSLLEACMLLTKMVVKFRFKLMNDETVDPVLPDPIPINQPSRNMKIEISLRI